LINLLSVLTIVSCARLTSQGNIFVPDVQITDYLILREGLAGYL